MLAAFTFIHVIISLIGILTGLVVIVGMLQGKRWPALTATFLATTILTSVTGFFFPVKHFMPSHAVGILSLILLAVAVYARYRRHLLAKWRWIFIATAIAAEFLNVFVGIVQSFLKVPALHALAPKGSEPPFAIAQSSALLAFVVLGLVAVKRFKWEADAVVPLRAQG